MKNRSFPFLICLVGWLVLPFASSTVWAQSLTLTGAQPASGAPGDRVQLQGQGFDRSAASYFAWGSDGERGFVLDITKKRSTTQLSALLANLYADVEGPVVLWRGRRIPVSPFRIGGGRFAVRDAFVFQPVEAAEGPSFAATAGPTAGFAGRLVDGAIHIDLMPPSAVVTASLPAGDEEANEAKGESAGSKIWEINAIVIECSAESCGLPPGGDGSGGGDGLTAGGFGFRFRIDCRDGGPCRGNPTTLLAAAFGGVLEDVGVTATVEGSTVVLSYGQSLCAAALNVTLSPALARGGASLQGGEALASSPARSSVAISR